MSPNIDVNVFYHNDTKMEPEIRRMVDGGVVISFGNVQIFIMNDIKKGREVVDSKVIKLIDCLRKVVYDGDPLKIAVARSIDNGITAESEEPRDKDYVDDRAIECFR